MRRSILLEVSALTCVAVIFSACARRLQIDINVLSLARQTPIKSRVEIQFPLTLKWTFKTGAAISASPLVTNERVLVGTLNRRLFVIDRWTSKKRGELSLKGTIEATPALFGSSLFIPLRGADQGLLAYDLGEGDWLWRAPLNDVAGTPIIIKSRVIAASYPGMIAALELGTGATVWNYSAGQTAPVVAPGFAGQETVAYVGTLDGTILALAVNQGGAIWKSHPASDSGMGFRTVPAVAESLVYVGGLDGTMYALRKKDGTTVWKYLTRGKIYSSACLDGNQVVFGSNDKTIYAVSADSGRTVWTFKTTSQVNASPVSAYGYLFCATADGTLLVLDRDKGTPVWEYKVRGPVTAAPVVYGNQVFFSGWNGRVYCFALW